MKRFILVLLLILLNIKNINARGPAGGARGSTGPARASAPARFNAMPKKNLGSAQAFKPIALPQRNIGSLARPQAFRPSAAANIQKQALHMAPETSLKPRPVGTHPMIPAQNKPMRINPTKTSTVINQQKEQQINVLKNNKNVQTVSDIANKAKTNPKINEQINKALTIPNRFAFERKFQNNFNRFKNFHKFNNFDFNTFINFFFFAPFLIFPFTFADTFYSDYPIDYPWWQPLYWDYDPFASQIQTTYIINNDYQGAIEAIFQQINYLENQAEMGGLTQDIILQLNKMGWLLDDIKREIIKSNDPNQQVLIDEIDQSIDSLRSLGIG